MSFQYYSGQAINHMLHPAHGETAIRLWEPASFTLPLLRDLGDEKCRTWDRNQYDMGSGLLHFYSRSSIESSGINVHHNRCYKHGLWSQTDSVLNIRMTQGKLFNLAEPHFPLFLESFLRKTLQFRPSTILCFLEFVFVFLVWIML